MYPAPTREIDIANTLQQHMGENVVRTIAMDGKFIILRRGLCLEANTDILKVPRVLLAVLPPVTLVPPSPFPSALVPLAVS